VAWTRRQSIKYIVPKTAFGLDVFAELLVNSLSARNAVQESCVHLKKCELRNNKKDITNTDFNTPERKASLIHIDWTLNA
jgi:hypothetical protein